MTIRRERQTTGPGHYERVLSICHSFRDGKIDRRSFIRQITAALTITALMPCPVFAENDKPLPATEWREDPWWTLYAVQEHLFPSAPDSPGATTLNATLYLKQELASTRISRDEAEFIINGVDWLNDLAQQTQSGRFVDLDIQKREAVLRQIEKSRAGERWLSLLIYYLIEALLTDPIYGGNPDGSGWKWLGHHVGLPRPVADKMYSKL